MLRDKETSKQKEYEIVLLDDLVPQDRILRKIDAAVDFSFIHDLCKYGFSPPNCCFIEMFTGVRANISADLLIPLSFQSIIPIEK